VSCHEVVILKTQNIKVSNPAGINFHIQCLSKSKNKCTSLCRSKIHFLHTDNPLNDTYLLRKMWRQLVTKLLLTIMWLNKILPLSNRSINIKMHSNPYRLWKIFRTDKDRNCFFRLSKNVFRKDEPRNTATQYFYNPG